MFVLGGAFVFVCASGGFRGKKGYYCPEQG